MLLSSVSTYTSRQNKKGHLTKNKTKDDTDDNRDTLIPGRTFDERKIPDNETITHANYWTPAA